MMNYIYIYILLAGYAFGFQLAHETIKKVESDKTLVWYCAAAAPVCLGAHTVLFLYKD